MGRSIASTKGSGGRASVTSAWGLPSKEISFVIPRAARRVFPDCYHTVGEEETAPDPGHVPKQYC